ncbi:glycoside hydrolase family 26 protein [Saccharicrinis aurantiacus]|uniref:glycoside hydrolase family 26 protein n=1 Tax=Saccharicrinis aurantiacus TaxID=1849719 RepID=UPI00094F9A87|nr:glycosyl hydrolase [Saccharicrinis aurantiacus]
MKLRKYTNCGVVALMLMSIVGCGSTENAQSQNQTEIISDLESVKGKGILFGHQDDLAYGMTWYDEFGESDVKLVAGDYPAMFGWELGGIELDHAFNLDTVYFESMKKLAIWGHQQGGINTFSWHPFSPIDSISSWNGDAIVVKHILPGGSHHAEFKKQLNKVGEFLSSLKDEDGNVIPFIFRPWHEMDGTWFWWGVKACTADEFKHLFRFSVEYLSDNFNLPQMVIAYSPDNKFSTTDEYLKWYPGDDIVDILGMDNYGDFKANGNVEDALTKLHIVIDLANKNGKLSALTETGLSNVTDSTWYSKKLAYVLNDIKVKENLSYAMVWRNDPKVHFFFPYPGHAAAFDAKAFLSQEHILLLNDFKQIK